MRIMSRTLAHGVSRNGVMSESTGVVKLVKKL